MWLGAELIEGDTNDVEASNEEAIAVSSTGVEKYLVSVFGQPDIFLVLQIGPFRLAMLTKAFAGRFNLNLYCTSLMEKTA